MSQETVTQGSLGKMSLDSDRLVDTLASVNGFPCLFQFNPLEAVESENQVQGWICEVVRCHFPLIHLIHPGTRRRLLAFYCSFLHHAQMMNY